MHIYIYIYLYNNIFTTFLLHVSVCYTPFSGKATRISAQNYMFFLYENARNGELQKSFPNFSVRVDS